MMSQGKRLLGAIQIIAAVLTLATTAAWTQAPGTTGEGGSSPVGTWVGEAQSGTHAVPFRLDVAGSGDHLRAALINGRERSPASSGSFENGHLVLHFDYYASTIEASIAQGRLTGTFTSRDRSATLTARVNGKAPAADANPPQIGGLWDVSVANGTKGEHSWKLRVRQTGPDVVAVIERIDGDTGNLYGTWQDGAVTASHFTAAGPSFIVMRPGADGTLQLEAAAHGGAVQTFQAHRVRQERTASHDTADDPLQHTFLKNPSRPLEFRFPDLDGKLVSSRDAEFSRKAMIVSIGGSWCPNCQDEAPFLEALYRKYQGRGLTIVELSFEESSQLQSLARLRAVIRRYGITYPVLVGGTPDQLSERFPQVEHLDCWPTTFFIGRDGLVKAIHTGYAGPATGKDNHKLEAEITAQVEQLLEVRPGASR